MERLEQIASAMERMSSIYKGGLFAHGFLIVAGCTIVASAAVLLALPGIGIQTIDGVVIATSGVLLGITGGIVALRTYSHRDKKIENMVRLAIARAEFDGQRDEKLISATENTDFA